MLCIAVESQESRKVLYPHHQRIKRLKIRFAAPTHSRAAKFLTGSDNTVVPSIYSYLY